MNLKDLMFQHGWKIHVEDYDGTLFVAMAGGHTDRETMANLLTLAGYQVSGALRRRGVYLYVYTNEPTQP